MTVPLEFGAIIIVKHIADYFGTFIWPNNAYIAMKLNVLPDYHVPQLKLCSMYPKYIIFVI